MSEPTTKELLGKVEELGLKIAESVNASKGFMTKDQMAAEQKKWTEEILHRIPAGPRDPIHAENLTASRKKLDEQFRFMALSNPRSFDEAKAKALGIAGGSEGGFLVPEEFRAEIIRKLIKRSVIRPNCRVLTGVSKKGVLPKETGTVSITFEGENVASTESTNPKFGQVPWTTYKMKALTKVPLELLRNSAIDVTDLVGTMYAEQMEVKEDGVFGAGTGIGQPLGLINASGVLNLGQSGGSLAYDDLVKTKHKLPVQYRMNPSVAWVMNNDALSLLARIKDNNGRPIFMELYMMGGQGTNSSIPAQTVGFVLGHPVLELASIPTTGTPATTQIWFGDLSRYYIFDEGSMEMSTTTEGFGTFEADQVAIKGLSFIDGKLVNEAAFVYLTGVK